MFLLLLLPMLNRLLLLLIAIHMLLFLHMLLMIICISPMMLRRLCAFALILSVGLHAPLHAQQQPRRRRPMSGLPLQARAHLHTT